MKRARIRYVTKLADLYIAGLEAARQLIPGGATQHPMPRSVDSKSYLELLIGEWASPRHVYVFRADGTYGVGDEQRDKCGESMAMYHIDDVSHGPIILLDRNYFVYACGAGASLSTREQMT